MLSTENNAYGIRNRVPIGSIEELEFVVKDREARTGLAGATFVGEMSDAVVSYHISTCGHGFDVAPCDAGPARFFVPADFVDHMIGHLIVAGRLYGFLN